MEAEIARLNEELRKARENERELEKSRRALLFVMGDLEEARQLIGKGKKEWETTFDAISDPIFIHDKKFKIVRANRAYAEAAGIKFKEFIGRPYYEVFPKMDGPFRMCVKSPDLQEEFLSPLTKRMFRVRFYPVKDINDKLLYSIYVMEDITEARKVEEALLNSEGSLKRAQEVAHIGSWNLDTAKNELTWSDETYRIFKIPIGTPLTYEKFLETVHPDDRGYVDKAWNDAIRKEPYDIEHRILVGGEIKWVREKAEVEFNEKDKSVKGIGSVQEITERKKAEEKIKQEMEVTSNFLKISKATANTTDIDRLMEEVVRCSSSIMGCDICLMYLWDKERKALMPGRAAGLPGMLVSVFMTEPIDVKADIVKKAFGKREPAIMRFDAPGKGSAFSWLPDADTIAAIPLFGKKGYLGLLAGVYVRVKPVPPEFTERDISVMEGIMHQVSTAVEDARLYKESLDRAMDLSRKMETIQVMHDIDKSILSTLESQEILETAIRMVAKVILCDRAIVALADKEKQGFIYAAGFGLNSISRGSLVPFETTSTTEVIETGRPQYVANLEESVEILPFEKKLIEEGFLSHIRVPLSVKGEVVGVLNVGSKRPSAFTSENLSTIEKLASQIEVALSNARLVSDLEELFIGTVKSLSSAIDAKSTWTAGHSERVTKYALDIGKEMGLTGNELKQLELAGILHDVGKIGTYEAILDKPDKLTDEELAINEAAPCKRRGNTVADKAA